MNFQYPGEPFYGFDRYSTFGNPEEYASAPCYQPRNQRSFEGYPYFNGNAHFGNSCQQNWDPTWSMPRISVASKVNITQPPRRFYLEKEVPNPNIQIIDFTDELDACDSANNGPIEPCSVRKTDIIVIDEGEKDEPEINVVIETAPSKQVEINIHDEEEEEGELNNEEEWKDCQIKIIDEEDAPKDSVSTAFTCQEPKEMKSISDHYEGFSEKSDEIVEEDSEEWFEQISSDVFA